MAFLDNSGDIILDAVLTDTGRMRLARGDGSFKIVKYALGDDEIDYESYNGNHSSGSAYYDLEILQTPIFEAFTNNTATMKNKLISLTNNNLLYLPMIKLNQKKNNFRPPAAGTAFLHSGSHVLVVDEKTRADLFSKELEGSELPPGFLNGEAPQSTTSNGIRIDQGLDTPEVSAALTLDPELKETQYIVEMDSRFCKLYDQQGDGAVASPSFIDDDLIATYYVTRGTGGYIEDQEPQQTPATENNNNSEIRGPRGTKMRFGLLAATDLVSSNYLFDVLGTDITGNNASPSSYAFIDTTVRVIGVTTGYRLDIPLRIVKLQN